MQYDDEGQPRIYVPDVTVVKEGKILGRDFETSKDTGGFDNPTDYWTDKKVKALDIFSTPLAFLTMVTDLNLFLPCKTKSFIG